MDQNTIPKDGVNPYASHPGFDATECPLRYTVSHRSPYGALGYCGFGCEMTGGHCLPGDDCEDKRARAAQQDEIRKLVQAGSNS
jgi:hypothetical protein